MTGGRPRIGLALSGGGFRATVFGLGALRALHDRGVLGDVTVVSGISGGSLLAAMWAYGPEGFTEFDTSVTSLVTAGLQWEIARRAAAPRAVLADVASLTRGVAGKPFGGSGPSPAPRLSSRLSPPGRSGSASSVMSPAPASRRSYRPPTSARATRSGSGAR